VGKKGISNKMEEGDNITPKGCFSLKTVFFRKDRMRYLKTKIQKIHIKKNMGWCDDSSSKYYNKLIRFPFNKSAEKLHQRNNLYDAIIVIDFNMKPVIKNKGSAIFIHIANKKYNTTKGCIAISKKDMRHLLRSLGKKNKITIF